MTSSFDRLIKNYSNARRNWESWCFMINVDCENNYPELPFYIRNDNFLSHYLYLSFKDFYIEIYKVVKKSSEDNIFNMLKKFISTNNDNVNACKALEDLNNIDPLITKICNIRDKYYAHLDKNFESYINSNTTSVIEYYKCFIAIENAIIVLSSKEMLQTYLDEIPSRNDFSFKI